MRWPEFLKNDIFRWGDGCHIRRSAENIYLGFICINGYAGTVGVFRGEHLRGGWRSGFDPGGYALCFGMGPASQRVHCAKPVTGGEFSGIPNETKNHTLTTNLMSPVSADISRFIPQFALLAPGALHFPTPWVTWLVWVAHTITATFSERYSRPDPFGRWSDVGGEEQLEL